MQIRSESAIGEFSFLQNQYEDYIRLTNQLLVGIDAVTALVPLSSVNFVAQHQVTGRYLDARSHTVPAGLYSAQSYSSKENLSLQKRIDTIIELRPSDAAEQLLIINSGIFH